MKDNIWDILSEYYITMWSHERFIILTNWMYDYSVKVMFPKRVAEVLKSLFFFFGKIRKDFIKEKRRVTGATISIIF